MIEALKNIGFIVTERLERKELSSDLQNRYSELPEIGRASCRERV